MSVNTIDLKHTSISCVSCDLYEVKGSNFNYEIEHLKEIQDAVLKLSDGVPVLLLIEAAKFTSVSPETREYITSVEGNKHATAKAFITKSLAQKILLNFMVKFQDPHVPTRFFSNRQEGLIWLNKKKNTRNEKH